MLVSVMKSLGRDYGPDEWNDRCTRRSSFQGWSGFVGLSFSLTFSGCHRHGIRPDERRDSQRGNCYQLDSSMSASVV